MVYIFNFTHTPLYQHLGGGGGNCGYQPRYPNLKNKSGLGGSNNENERSCCLLPLHKTSFLAGKTFVLKLRLELRCCQKCLRQGLHDKKQTNPPNKCTLSTQLCAVQCCPLLLVPRAVYPVGGLGTSHPVPVQICTPTLLHSSVAQSCRLSWHGLAISFCWYDSFGNS